MQPKSRWLLILQVGIVGSILAAAVAHADHCKGKHKNDPGCDSGGNGGTQPTVVLRLEPLSMGVNATIESDGQGDYVNGEDKVFVAFNGYTFDTGDARRNRREVFMHFVDSSAASVCADHPDFTEICSDNGGVDPAVYVHGSATVPDGLLRVRFVGKCVGITPTGKCGFDEMPTDGRTEQIFQLTVNIDGFDSAGEDIDGIYKILYGRTCDDGSGNAIPDPPITVPATRITMHFEPNAGPTGTGLWSFNPFDDGQGTALICKKIKEGKGNNQITTWLPGPEVITDFQVQHWNQ